MNYLLHAFWLKKILSGIIRFFTAEHNIFYRLVLGCYILATTKQTSTAGMAEVFGYAPCPPDFGRMPDGALTQIFRPCSIPATK